MLIMRVPKHPASIKKHRRGHRSETQVTQVISRYRNPEVLESYLDKADQFLRLTDILRK